MFADQQCSKLQFPGIRLFKNPREASFSAKPAQANPGFQPAIIPATPFDISKYYRHITPTHHSLLTTHHSPLTTRFHTNNSPCLVLTGKFWNENLYPTWYFNSPIGRFNNNIESAINLPLKCLWLYSSHPFSYCQGLSF